MIKGVVFDLDGTLINTLCDITDALNEAFKFYHLKEISQEQTKALLDNGIKELIKEVLDSDEEGIIFHNIYHYYRAYYQKHSINKSYIYEGVLELLDGLTNDGIKCFILSNQPQQDIIKIINHYFNNIFSGIYGCHDEVTKKPNPYYLEKIMFDNHINPNDLIMVGDTEIDIKTAKKAKCKSIGCGYGFKDYLEFSQCGASYVVSSPLEILKIISNLNK